MTGGKLYCHMEGYKTNTIENFTNLYELNGYDLHAVSGHEGGRNEVYICMLGGEKKYVLRVSATGDRTEEE